MGKEVLTIKDFNLQSAIDNGGTSGSKRVRDTRGRSTYQLKYPAANEKKLGKKLKNRSKNSSVTSERENIGEYIAGCIANKIAHENSEIDDVDRLSPDISLVYDEMNHFICISSKYLSNSVTLDDFIANEEDRRRASGKEPKHIKIVSGNSKNREQDKNEYFLWNIDADNQKVYGINGDEKGKLINLTKEELADIKKQMAELIVRSGRIIDNDINPGNVMVLLREGKYKVVRIDYGHVFGSMHRGFGRKVLGSAAKDNYMQDYFNRGGTAGHGILLPNGGKTNQEAKLWRDYPGMMPSQEIVDALRKYSQAEQQQLVIDGLEDAKAGLNQLVDKIFSNEPSVKFLRKNVGISVVKKAINHQINVIKQLTKEQLGNKDEIRSFINKNFKEYDEFEKDTLLKSLFGINKNGIATRVPTKNQLIDQAVNYKLFSIIKGYQSTINVGNRSDENFVDYLNTELGHPKNKLGRPEINNEDLLEKINLRKQSEVRNLLVSVKDINTSFSDNKDLAKIEKSNYQSPEAAKTKIGVLLDEIGEVCIKNSNQMELVADIMQLQVDIDRYIMGEYSVKRGEIYIEIDLISLKRRHDDLIGKQINVKEITKSKEIEEEKSKGLDWIKVKKGDKNQGFRGGFAEYVGARMAQLNSETVKSSEVKDLDEKKEPSHNPKPQRPKVLAILNKERTNPNFSKLGKDSKNKASPKNLKKVLDDEYPVSPPRSTDDAEMEKIDSSIELIRFMKTKNEEVTKAELGAVGFNKPDMVGGIGVDLEFVSSNIVKSKHGEKQYFSFKITNIHKDSSVDAYNKKYRNNRIKVEDIIIVPANDEKEAVAKIRDEGLKKDGDITIRKRNVSRWRDGMDKIRHPLREEPKYNRMQNREIEADINTAVLQKKSGNIYELYNFNNFIAAEKLKAEESKAIN